MRTLQRPILSRSNTQVPRYSRVDDQDLRHSSGVLRIWRLLPTLRLRLPGLIGLLAIFGIAALAATVLSDGLLAYGVFAVAGLAGIFALDLRDKRRHLDSPLSLVPVSLNSALHSLALIAEARDQELSGHSERVAKNSVAIGIEMGIGKPQLEELWWAGLLHDVGKIGLPESILQKPGPLFEAEKCEVRKHPEYGAEIVYSFCTGYPSIPDAIRFHHERWDGLGYPSGLSKGEIPLFARIVAVADVFEALTNQRPYRAALTSEQAAIYIRRETGTHFAPDVVKAFETLHRSDALLVAPEQNTRMQSMSPGLTIGNVDD